MRSLFHREESGSRGANLIDCQRPPSPCSRARASGFREESLEDFRPLNRCPNEKEEKNEIYNSDKNIHLVDG